MKKTPEELQAEELERKGGMEYERLPIVNHEPVFHYNWRQSILGLYFSYILEVMVS